MSITPFLNGERFDPEGRRVLSVALEMVCIALRTGDCDDHVKQAIADKIIALAKAGERNPDILCERALEEIREPHPLDRPLGRPDARSDFPRQALSIWHAPSHEEDKAQKGQRRQAAVMARHDPAQPRPLPW